MGALPLVTAIDDAELSRLAIKNLFELDTDRDELATLYLHLPVIGRTPQGVPSKLRSSLEALLADTRLSAGRNETNTSLNFDQARNWLGAMGYLALVDQISKALEVPQGSARGDTTNFERLLLWDGCVDPTEAAAIYALRCAFVHSYGLLNDPERRSAERTILLRHQFQVTADEGDLIKVRGDRLVPLEELQATTVDLITLGNTVEQLVSDLRSANLEGNGLSVRSTIEPRVFVRSSFFAHHP